MIGERIGIKSFHPILSFKEQSIIYKFAWDKMIRKINQTIPEIRYNNK